MVVPGWNVTEPIQVAHKLLEFIQEYRGASDQVEAFALQIKTYCASLEDLDEHVKHVELSPTDNNTSRNLRETLGGFNLCAEHCRTFIKRFKSLEDEADRQRLSATVKLTWVLSKGRFQNLRHEIDSQATQINLLLNIAAL
jgi:hypothetical protein